MIINIFAGPGSGKSTIAAGLFSYMKIHGYKCELVTEYAKSQTYLKAYHKLKDQIHVFAKQHHKIWQCNSDVDYVITDSPLLLSIAYLQDDYIPGYRDTIEEFVVTIFNSYDNVNIFLKRNDSHYQTYGRTQSLDEAIEIDNIILGILDKHNVPYHVIELPSGNFDDYATLLEMYITKQS